MVDPAHVFGFGTDGPPAVLFQGEAGAVRPAGAMLRVYGLGSEDPAVGITPAPDGSFAVEVPIGDDGERSLPVDVVVDGTGRVAPAERLPTLFRVP